jgi:phosphoserine phosphatase RsbU/P
MLSVCLQVLKCRLQHGFGTCWRTIFKPLMNTPTGPASPADAELEPLRILVVDDDIVPRMVVAHFFEQGGHHVLQADSGRAALELMNRDEVDLISLDLGMTDGDGFFVLAELRKQHSDRWRPVIVISGHNTENLIIKALDSGADDFMTKPVNYGFLRAKIRNFQRVIGIQRRNMALLDTVSQTNQALQSRLDYEERFSQRIQKTLLMGSIPPLTGGVYVTARAEARQGVNGDFIEVTSIFPNTVDLIVGDVMGKGPLAALMGADVKLEIQRYIAQSVIDKSNQLLSVSQIINAIHAQLTHKLSDLDSFVTLAYIRINCTLGTVSAVSCGHMQPLLINGDRVRPIGSQHLPLGVMESEIYTEEVVEMGPGDSLLCFSDGVTDARNPDGEVFGEERLIAAASRCSRSIWGPAARIDLLREELNDFLAGARPTDDLTLLVAVFPLIAPVPRRLQAAKDLSEIAQVQTFVHGNTVELNLPEHVMFKVELAVVEVFTNVVRHSRTGLAHSSVDLLMWREDQMVYVALESIGNEFDPSQHVVFDPDDLSIDHTGGFGLHIITTLTDELKYTHTSGINRIQLGFSLLD